MDSLIGTGVALITPFKKDLSVDVTALQKLVKFQIENGINYLVVLGTTAETATLSSAEKNLIIETIIAANNKHLPLVLGIGSNNTAQVVDELQTRNLDDFCAILSVSPYYNKPTQEGIYQHFKAISNASPIPVILYNVPGRTASNMEPKTVLRLANDFKNIVAIKEAKGDLMQAMELIKNKPKDFLVISGDDMIALPMILAGGSGVISVIGQGFPSLFSTMVQFGLQDKVRDAYQIHYSLATAIDMIFEQGNPAGIKEVLQTLNISDNQVRLPLVQVDSDLALRLKNFTTTI